MSGAPRTSRSGPPGSPAKPRIAARMLRALLIGILVLGIGYGLGLLLGHELL